MQNYIFFKIETDIDKPIYRVFSIERFLEVYHKGKLVLVKPKKWDDPFENFILKSKARLETGEHVEFSFAHSMYGQCWSFDQESDTMWRIYSHQKNGVKIRTTPRKLREALAAEIQYPELSAFIGCVMYKEQVELLEMVNDRVMMHDKVFDSTGRGHAETLLFKRMEFSHENEVRLIYSGTQEDAVCDVFKFKIDPHDLFDEVIFDPRMDENLTSIYKQHLVATGFRGRVDRSTLYDVPNLTVSA